MSVHDEMQRLKRAHRDVVRARWLALTAAALFMLVAIGWIFR